MLERLSVQFALRARDPLLAVSRLLTRTLENPGRHAVDTLISLAFSADHTLLCQLGPVLKARALEVLSTEAMDIFRQSGGMPSDVIQAGQKLVLATAVPESIVNFFDESEAALLQDLKKLFCDGTGNLMPGLFAERQVSYDFIRSFSGAFLDRFSEAYNLEKGIALKAVHEPGGAYGQAYWDKILGMATVEANLADIKTVQDLAKLVVTLGHEAMHTINRQIHRADIPWEQVRQEWPDAYVYKAITNPVFYSTANIEVYQNHPEEIFVERVGLRLGIKFARMIGLEPSIDMFAKESLGVLPRAEIVKQLADLFSNKDTRRQAGRAEAAAIRL